MLTNISHSDGLTQAGDIYHYSISCNLFQTMFRAIAEFSSSLVKAVLSLRSQTNGVVSSAKLHTSTSLRAKNKSLK